MGKTVEAAGFFIFVKKFTLKSPQNIWKLIMRINRALMPYRLLRMDFWRNNPSVLKQKFHNHRRPAQTARLNPQRTLVSCDDFRHHT